MKICVIGTGYVGLVSGACFAEIGHHVTCVDIHEDKIAKLRDGQMPIYEPGLEDLVARNQDAGRLIFTTQIQDAIDADVSVFFICVGTPASALDGGANLDYVFAAVGDIARHAAIQRQSRPEQILFVTKSTVPVGTNSEIEQIVGRYIPSSGFAISSNPEFLREGAAIKDFMNPDRIVIGSSNAQARRTLEEIYRPIAEAGAAVHLVSSVQTAELVKYVANAFLATKISFINEVARLAEEAGADIDEVVAGVGADARIGRDFLTPGPGYGGSCFPKDTQALVKTAIEYNSPLTIVEAVIAANHRHKLMMISKIRKAIGGRLEGKRIAVLGLAFKANTDDMRDSPALVIVPGLVRLGAQVVGYDPIAGENAQLLMPDIRIEADVFKAAKDADAVVILTEWPEFRDLDLNELMENSRGKTVIDLRNVMSKQSVERFAGAYCGLGKPNGQHMIDVPVEMEVA
ncbi:UDP-glucose/GDP-mannose dehydrogenase family protein [Neorhizobium sp. JUb45]|uniref:UDP-glucose dehydrogenase family protein n=1 Tax=unclassified Neorhizobium TaxID=2629175 RepID=UPI00104C136B|nr:UDP-glucose/GDP-mannose dehydrogenase family protein [Neorhizobium sp. JUb45]TCQ98259.1 UDPglucose 6-dehydrogenase [Neorhizobium sp. JUb45]